MRLWAWSPQNANGWFGLRPRTDNFLGRWFRAPAPVVHQVTINKMEQPWQKWERKLRLHARLAWNARRLARDERRGVLPVLSADTISAIKELGKAVVVVVDDEPTWGDRLKNRLKNRLPKAWRK